MREVVINSCFGGFGLSKVGLKLYNKLAKTKLDCSDRIDRDDYFLVQVVKQLGHKADGDCARLEIVEIPSDVEWHIHEYDGIEHVAEDHRTWGKYL